MTRVNVKYPVGRMVCLKVGGIPGMITAVTIRGKDRHYEFSYSKDGTPSSVNVEEVEIEDLADRPFGFRK